MSRKWLTLLSMMLIFVFVASCTTATVAPTAKPVDPTKPAATAVPATAVPATKAPTAVPSKYSQSPTFDADVAAGKLPAVDKRVSDEPLVVKAIEEVGTYGGTLRRAWKGPSDIHAYMRLNYTEVLAWPRNPTDPIQPNLAKEWKFSADGKELTLFFRKGLKWSDGSPWTVDDIIFWWEDIENDKNLTAAPHAEWIVNGKPMTLEKIDAATIKLKFDGPNGLAERMLAFHGNQWPLGFERFGFFAPATYLKQFHPKYNKAITDYKQFNDKADETNPDRPGMTPWVMSVYKAGDQKSIAKRNPYFWKVDEKGQQLPYIDTIDITLVENNDAIANQALSCNTDFEFRGLDIKKFSLFKEKETACAYRAIRWPNAQGTALALWPNQSYAADPVLAKIFQDKNFRIALSYAMDRKKINTVTYLDQGVIRSSMIVPTSAFYVPEVENLYTDYDVKKAAEYLDKAGLKMGPDGKTRLRPDGKPLEITIETERTGAELDALNMIVEQWTAVGVKTALKAMIRDTFWTRAGNNEVQVAVWSTDRGLEPFVDPIYLFPFDERSWMAPAYGTYYKTAGKLGIKPEGKLAEAQVLFDKMRGEVDKTKFVDLGKQIVKMAVEEVWTLQTVGMMPGPVIIKSNLKNLPTTYTQDWIIMAPGNMDPCTWFYKK